MPRSETSRPRYEDLLQSPGGGSEVLRYPMDITDDTGQLDFTSYPHWVVFYPLVRESDKRAARLNSGDVFIQEDQNRMDPDHVVAATAAAGAIVGAKTGAGSSLVSNLSKLGGNVSGGNNFVDTVVSGISNAVGKIGNTIVGGLIGGTVGAAAGTAAGAAQRDAKLLMGTKAVALHVSEKISATYGANWEQVDLGGLVGALGSGKFQQADMIDNGMDLAQYALRKTAKIGGLVEGDRLLNTIEAGSKKVENPYKEQLFKNMEFRKFAFDYKFMPKNREEAMQILGTPKYTAGYIGRPAETNVGILHTFLRHMHPERSGGGMFLHYPSEFLIVYYHNGKENQFVRKISNCALTNMSIDYGAEGFTTFQGTDGMPTEITIRLEFLELEALTYERIERGY